MIKLKVPEEAIREATRLVDSYNFGTRGHADGNRTNQVVGIVGELMIRQLLQMPPIEPNGFDGGFDLHFRDRFIDVKTMGRTTDPRPDFINNVIASQIRYRATHFLFLSLNKRTRTLWICGGISKKDLLDKATFRAEGFMQTRSDGSQFKIRASMYEIMNKDLIPINSLGDFFNYVIFYID